MFNCFYIYKNKLLSNLNEIKKQNPHSKICAMVKANAYGLGINQIVRLLDNRVDFFGVSNYAEAKVVRRLTQNKILIVSALERKKILDESFSYACHSIEDVEYLISLNKPFKIHLKINTGMNRFGFANLTEFKSTLELIKASRLILEGVFTHFATTDKFVEVQFERFFTYVNLVKKFGFKPIVHADNSFVNLTHNHGFDMVRIGFSLYNFAKQNFCPVAEIFSTVLQLNDIKSGDLVGYDRRFIANKPMLVAVLSLGYADGFDMHLIGFNLNVKGVDCRVLNVCMDCIMLDVSNVKIKKGDKVAILNNDNSLKKYAKYLNTTEYEVMTKFSFIRSKRIVKN